MSENKIIIAVGGTAGHVYPALAVAHRLTQLESSLSVLFLGGGLSSNRFFDPGIFPYRDISCSSFSLRKPLQFFTGGRSILRGIGQSYRCFKHWGPSLVIGFGSYYTLPVLLAAKWAKVPYVLHEQNRIPGRVNRLFSRHALFTGICFPEAGSLLKGKTVDVEMPLRQIFSETFSSKESARESYGLDPTKPVVLVFGGSQGAHAINRLIDKGVQESDAHSLQFLHFTGDPASTRQLQQRYHSCGIQACVKDYESNMPIAWKAADIVVSRAGSGTISEQIACGVPGILIPYPFSMDNHQEKNADSMEAIGAGKKLRENTLTPRTLREEIYRMLDADQLKRSQQAIKNYREERQVQDFSQSICQLLMGETS
ncbi:MAG: UDP-N-acetylglucosamine--N-acetylmuramyl-(pentapeptide) pyrophosphoryl-undecaprenol N-acetylglucosamine transferase [Waddliaceae bacterium]